MPKIPDYGGEKVQQAPIKGPMVPTEAPLAAFGGGQAAADTFGAAAGIANTVEHLAGQEWHRQYQNAVNQQSMELGAQLLKEQVRVKGELANLSGPDAQKATNSVAGDYQKFYQGIEKGIQNDDVRQNVYAHYMNNQAQLDAFAQHNADVKMKQWDQEQFTSEGQTYLDSATQDPSPKNVATLALGRKLAIQQFAQRNGLPPEWVAAQQAAQSSKIYFMALNTLASSGQDRAAKNFFDINKQDLVGEDLVRAQKIVEDGSRLGLAYRVADATFQTPHETIADAKATAAKIAGADYEDPETRRAIDQQVERSWHQAKIDQKVGSDKAFEDASRLVWKTGDPSQIDRNTWLNVLTDEDRRKIMSLSNALSKPPRIEDDPQAYNHWNFKSDEQKLQMSEADFMREVMTNEGLSAKTKEKFSDQMKALRSKDDAKVFKWTHEDKNYVFDTIQKAGLFNLTGSDRPGTLKGDKALQVKDFMIQAEKLAEKKTGGKPLDHATRDELVDEMIKDSGLIGEMTPSWWQYVAPVGKGSDFIGAFSPWWGVSGENAKIPDADRAGILRNYPNASEQKIQLLYKAQKGGMGAYGLKMLGDQTK